MGNILYNRVLEKIPGNRQKEIEAAVVEFSRYVRRFSTQTLVYDPDNNAGEGAMDGKEITNDQIMIRVHTFYFLQ